MKKTGQLIVPGKDGDPRRQADQQPYEKSSAVESPPKTPHSFTLYSSMRKRGQLNATNAYGSENTGGNSVAQAPLFYDYRKSTPDKYYFPRNRRLANAVWREMYRRDAVVSIATDMYSELPWSAFDLVGIDDPGIKKVYEDMFNKLNLVPKLAGFTRDYLITGELILHAIFDSTEGIWERVIPHDPDYVRIEGVGLAVEQPLLWLLPTPEIRKLVNAQDPLFRRLQKFIPRDIMNAFRMNRAIPLESLNTTFLARKINSTDIRGTSFYTRLYRTTMYEDFVVNASLAIAQRHAAPLRIFKLGDPATGWLGSQEDEEALAYQLSLAESDPLAAIITHNALSVELVGVSDRVLLISREWDFIERIKLLAMGIAKSFLVGETSFASAVAGLQTLLERLASIRMLFEQEWIIKKLCVPIAEMHDFYKTPEKELENRIRVQRPKDPLVPTIKWRKNLDPSQDVSILGVWRDLKDRGILSDRTYSQGAGVDLDVERKNQEEERQYVVDHPEFFPEAEGEEEGEEAPGPAPRAPRAPRSAPGGGGGGGASPLPLPGASKQSSITKEFAEDLEDQISKLAEMDDRVHVQDVLDLIKSNGPVDVDTKKRIDNIERLIPKGGANLLTGSG